MKTIFTRLFWPAVIFAVCFFAVKPILIPGFFPVHDDTQPSRIDQMTKALASGQFPVRMVADLGYGYSYPLFNFYAPLPYYVGSLFQIIGFSSIVSAKFMFIAGILLSGITMFYLGRKLSGNTGGFMAAVLYVYAPYHAVDIYVRGAVGEYYAMAFLPLLMLGISEIFDIRFVKSAKKIGFNPQKGMVFASLGLAGTLLSHNITGMLCIIVIAVSLPVWVLIKTFHQKKIYFLIPILTVLFFGVGLSAFFTMPALVEKKYTKVEELITGGSNFRDHFVYIDQLWDSPWGYGGSAPGRADGMSFKLGKVQIILGIFSLLSFLYLYLRKKDSIEINPAGIIFPVLLLVSIFMMTEPSKFIWNAIPWFAYIQYPWRLLVFSSFALAAIGASGHFYSGRKGWLIALALFFLTVYINGKYFQPQQISSLTDRDYTGRTVLQTKISRISDEYLPADFTVPPANYRGIANGLSGINGITVLEAIESPAKKIYRIEPERTMEVVSNIAYFPGWSAKVDGKKTGIGKKYGLISLLVPEGMHVVEFELKDTPVRLMGNTISLLSLFLLLYVSLSKDLFLWPKKNQ